MFCLFVGKGLSIWDTFCHQGDHIANSDTGDIACNSYHKYKEDIQLLADMGVSQTAIMKSNRPQ